MANLSTYAAKLPPEAQRRYLDKIGVISSVDPFSLACNGNGESNNPAAQPSPFPPLDASDLVSYLVLQTSYVSAKQFKARKSLEAYNQFLSSWVKEVRSWSILDKTVVTGKVSFTYDLRYDRIQQFFTSYGRYGTLRNAMTLR